LVIAEYYSPRKIKAACPAHSVMRQRPDGVCPPPKEDLPLKDEICGARVLNLQANLAREIYEQQNADRRDHCFYHSPRRYLFLLLGG
jgi:hypothetical protein